jgi:hypothetical protein
MYDSGVLPNADLAAFLGFLQPVLAYVHAPAYDSAVRLDAILPFTVELSRRVFSSKYV